MSVGKSESQILHGCEHHDSDGIQKEVLAITFADEAFHRRTAPIF